MERIVRACVLVLIALCAGCVGTRTPVPPPNADVSDAIDSPTEEQTQREKWIHEHGAEWIKEVCALAKEEREAQIELAKARGLFVTCKPQVNEPANDTRR
jgi:hypothetical protein